MSFTCGQTLCLFWCLTIMLKQTVWDKPSAISCWCRSNDSEICIINWLLHVACYWLNPGNPEPVLSLKPVQLCNTIDLSVFNYCQLVVSPYCPASLAFFLGQSWKIAGVWMHRTDWLAVCVELLCFVGLLSALCWALTFCSALCQAVCLCSPGCAGTRCHPWHGLSCSWKQRCCSSCFQPT